MNKKVVCLIVTYNRKVELEKNLVALFEQTLMTDILIFDNASTDGTYEYLKEKGYLEKNNLFYHKSNKNLGGSYGFSKGVEMLYKQNYDYIILMDDDGRPKNNYTLEKLVEKAEKFNEPIMLNSLVICDNNELSFQLNGCTNYDELLSMVKSDFLENEINPFNGTLINKLLIDKIGIPKENFFIKGDEYEYHLRALRSNAVVGTVMQSIYYHPKEPCKIIKIGKLKLRITEEAFWKEYYKARNHMYICKHYCSCKSTIKFVVMTLFKCLIFKEDRKRKSKYVLKGLVDGYRENFQYIKF